MPTGKTLVLFRDRSQLEISLFKPNSATAKPRCSTSALRVPRYSWFDVKYMPDIMTPSTTTPNSAVISAIPLRSLRSLSGTGFIASTALWFCIDDLT
jgi:hypothetical protein